MLPTTTSAPNEEEILKWIFKHPQEEKSGITKISSLIGQETAASVLIEIGPRFNFSTAQSTNSVSICQNVGLSDITRIEVSIKYLIGHSSSQPSQFEYIDKIFNVLGDKMTQCLYTQKNIPANSFVEQLPKHPESWYSVPLLENGRTALEEINEKLGLSFDNWDLEFYQNLFENVLKRNPTSVELFDCAQSNSEHSRHWFFKGTMVVDGEKKEKSLIKMIIETQQHSNKNNTISFSDNSSAIKGYKHAILRRDVATGPGVVEVQTVTSDLIFTAETHNMPTAVAPFSGATTGTGGRIR